MRKLVILFFAVLFILGCGESDDARYEAGYDDGSAVGYNTTCKKRVTMIAGDWDDPNYSKGYADGLRDGIRDCQKERKR